MKLFGAVLASTIISWLGTSAALPNPQPNNVHELAPSDVSIMPWPEPSFSSSSPSANETEVYSPSVSTSPSVLLPRERDPGWPDIPFELLCYRNIKLEGNYLLISHELADVMMSKKGKKCSVRAGSCELLVCRGEAAIHMCGLSNGYFDTVFSTDCYLIGQLAHLITKSCTNDNRKIFAAAGRAYIWLDKPNHIGWTAVVGADPVTPCRGITG